MCTCAENILCVGLCSKIVNRGMCHFYEVVEVTYWGDVVFWYVCVCVCVVPPAPNSCACIVHIGSLVFGRFVCELFIWNPIIGWNMLSGGLYIRPPFVNIRDCVSCMRNECLVIFFF